VFDFGHLAWFLMYFNFKFYAMKKIILSFFFISFLVSSGVSAQGLLVVTDLLNNDVTGSTISIDTSNIDASTMDVYLNVTNNSEQELNLYVRRIINSSVNSSTNSFCFGICYPVTTDTSNAVAVAPGNSTSFSSDYSPNLGSGLTSITYEFYDNRTTGTPITAQVTINFRVSPVGITHESKAFNISAAFPNPSSASTSFEYNIPVGNSGKIILRNLIGSIVSEVVLEKPAGRAALNTNDLPEGVYFYSFIVESKAVLTKKLVVRH
jgi:hypothetical protein